MQIISAVFDAYAFLFGRAWLAKFNKALVLAGLRGQGILNYQNFEISGEKGFAQSALKTHSKRRSANQDTSSATIFDVGGNVGNWALMIESIQSGAPYKLFAFEPSPDTFATLAARTSHIPSIATFNIGLSDHSGIVQMHDYASSAHGSSHASIEDGVITSVHGKSERTFEVKVITGDRFCKENQIDFIDFLKIDVEGHELKVLQGFQGMITSRKVGVIQFEFNETMIPSRTFLEDFRAILNGYKMFRILPKGRLLPIRRRDIQIFRYQNIAAILDKEISE